MDRMVWKAFALRNPTWSHFTLWTKSNMNSFHMEELWRSEAPENVVLCLDCCKRDITENLRWNWTSLYWHLMSKSSGENVNHLDFHCEVAANLWKTFPICWSCNGLCLQMFSSIWYVGMGRHWEQNQQGLVLHPFTELGGNHCFFLFFWNKHLIPICTGFWKSLCNCWDPLFSLSKGLFDPKIIPCFWTYAKKEEYWILYFLFIRI